MRVVVPVADGPERVVIALAGVGIVGIVGIGRTEAVLTAVVGAGGVHFEELAAARGGAKNVI